MANTRVSVLAGLALAAILTSCGGGGSDSSAATPDSAAGSSGTSSSGTGSSTGSASSGSGSTTTNSGNASSGSTSGSGSTSSGGSGSGSSGASNAYAGAPESVPVGYGAATTGAGSSPVTVLSVASLADAQKAVDAYQAAGGTSGLKLTYTGTFDFATIPDPCTQFKLPSQKLEIKGQKSKPLQNITIIGADGSAANFGIHVVGLAANVIIRNMTIGLTPGGGDADIVGIEGSSDGAPKNVWVDHNSFFTSLKECAGAGDTAFDGMVDAKKGATNVTVSYNYLHDHHKTSLNGFSDSDTVERLITFHHNVFENLGSRVPLQRGGYSHMLNNLFSNILVSAVNVRMGGYSLVEGNYFENVQNPVTSRDSSALGYWELLNNNIMSPADFSTYGIKWVKSDSSPSKDASDWTSTATFPRQKLAYAYTAQSPACVKNGLASVAGAGKGLASLLCK